VAVQTRTQVSQSTIDHANQWTASSQKRFVSFFIKLFQVGITGGTFSEAYCDVPMHPTRLKQTGFSFFF